MPTRTNTSASDRVIVVLPVPPFWERTAIVSAIGADYMRGGPNFRQSQARHSRAGGAQKGRNLRISGRLEGPERLD